MAVTYLGLPLYIFQTRSESKKTVNVKSNVSSSGDGGGGGGGGEE